MSTKVNVSSPMRYFNEYMYHQFVNAVNRYRTGHNLPSVKKRQAMQIRENLGAALQEKGKTMANAGKSVFLDTMAETFEKAGVDMSALNRSGSDSYYNAVLQRFSQITGIQASKSFGDGAALTETAALPLSPYDPRFAMRSTFLENGTKVLYADADELGAKGQLTPDNFNEMFHSGLTLYEAKNGNILEGRREVGPALDAGDASGYAILSTLVSERNAREIKAFVNQDGSPSPMYCSPEQVQQAYQVLSALKDEGISFEFKRDERPGQLKAKVSMTGMPPIDVRVLDPYSPQYGGCSRIYLDGVQGYYSTDKHERRVNPATGKSEMINTGYNPTVKERVDLIKFGLGQQIMRGDGKPVGTPGTYRDGKTVNNESYHSGKSFSAMVRPYPGGGNSKVFLRLTSNRTADNVHFKSAEESDDYLLNAVESARENYSRQFNINGLIEDARAHEGEPDYVPAYSPDADVAAIQMKYWEVLRGEQGELLQPGATVDEFEDSMAALDETGMRGSVLEDYVRGTMAYQGTPEEKVQQHFDDLLESQIGTFMPDDAGKRFDPVNVAKYMKSPYGQYRNSADIVVALKSSGISADDLKGNTFYNQTIKDNMIEFDRASARQMRFEQDPFMKSMYEAVRDAVTENGCQVSEKDILIDDNGIIEYRATKFITKGSTAKGRKDIVGHVGQVFAPDEKGLVTTKFAGSDNYKFCPGMTADVVPNKAGEDLPYEQRVKIKTYQMSMAEGIRFAIRDDLMNEWAEVGSNTSLNGIPRRNQGVRFEAGELESKPERLRQAILDAETSRVVFSNDITRNAGRYDLYRYTHDPDHDPNDDVHIDAIQLMGGQNYAILRPEESAGIFDPEATGTGPAQGSRYLVKGAKVGDDGRIIPAMKDDGTIDKEARNGLAEYINEHGGSFDAIDRFDMTVTALRHCKGVAPAKIAQVTFGGWCHGDAVVVSKEWADKNDIHNIGDKVSDFHGNKGVVSLIVDRNMDMDEARRLKIEEPVKWFQENPTLDMVMNPYSAVSRFNGGLYREALSNQAEDLVYPAGPDGHKQVVKGAIGQLDMIIMEQTADKKSTDYTDEETVETTSRNFGGQTGWSLGSNGATATIQEAFSHNARSVVAFREMLIATGMDLDETGTMRIGYQPHEGEQRPLFEMQPLVMKYKTDRSTGEKVADMDAQTGRQKVDYQSMKADFGTNIEQSGGMMELPFPVKFPVGKAQDEHGNLVNMGYTPEIPDEERSDASKAAYGGKTYAVPVVSAYLRSGQEFNDGTSRVHDYTNQYIRLYECGLKYRDMAENGASKEELAKVQAQGQQEYNKITDDIIGTKFGGKHNVIRTTLLGAKQKAMTAVITPDPRLDLEEISINPEMAAAMNVKEGQKILTWRDPLLTRTGMSSNTVRFDEAQRCMGVSPFTGEDKDADHDGDTEGLRPFTTKEARIEADNQLNIKNRLLKTSSPPDKNGYYELSLDSGEDHEAGLCQSPGLRDVYDGLKVRINEMERKAQSGKLAGDALDTERKSALKAVNDYVHAVQDASYGAHAISYSDPEACFRSISEYVEAGVKGNAKKLDTFGRYFGVSYERGADGSIDYKTFKDEGVNVASAQEKLDPLDARNMQQAYTGPAGGQTIQSMVYAASATDRDFTNGLTGRKVTAAEIMDAFTATNKGVTQGVLQVKHSASQARQMEEVIQNYLGSAAAGYAMCKVKNPVTGETVWERAKDKDGKSYQATALQYTQQMTDIYENDLGVSVVPEKIKIMADFLSDKDGYIKTPEQRRREAPPLQRMAYDGAGDNGFATVQQMAYEGRNLYEGSPNLNAAMMPKQLRHNQAVKAANKEMNFLDEFEAEANGKQLNPNEKMAPLVETRTRITGAQMRADSKVQTVSAPKSNDRDLSGYDIPADGVSQELSPEPLA